MYPFNSFLHLVEFCHYGRFEDTLSQYKLVAIPFIAPEDRAVRNALKYHFERLHITTGESFACITFVNPPLRWQKEHQGWMNRPWMKVNKNLSTQIYTDEGRIDAAIRTRFDLPPCSCLLLTDSLGSNHYVVMPVNEFDLVEKLEAIGRFATQYPEHFPVNAPFFEGFLSRYDSVFVETTENGESVAQNITDILAVDSLFYNSEEFNGASEYVQSQAQSWIANSLDNLLEQTHSAKGEDLDAILKRYSDYLALILETYNTAPTGISHHTSPPYGIAENRSLSSSGLKTDSLKDFFLTNLYDSYFTPVSLRAKESYNCLLPFVMMTPGQRCKLYPDYLSSHKVDYACLGLYLGHIIEEEMNASVVQLARKNAGIEMPRYYRLWDERNRKLQGIDTGNGCIYLNRKYDKKGKHFKVKMLGIGQAALAVDLMHKAHPEMEFGPFGKDDFLSRMKEFAQYRNLADHPSDFTKHTFIAAHQLFTDICKNDLDAMAKLKESLQKKTSNTQKG